MTLLLDQVSQIEKRTLTEIVVLMVSKISSCIFAGKQLKLPLFVQALMWSRVHQLRCSLETKQAWSVLMWDVTKTSCHEAHLAQQLLLDGLLKKLLHNQAEIASKKKQGNPLGRLIVMESNAVRHMAGYVAVKKLKQFKKPPNYP